MKRAKMFDPKKGRTWTDLVMAQNYISPGGDFRVREVAIAGPGRFAETFLSVLKSHFNWPPAMNVSYCKTVVQPLRRKIRWHTLVAKEVGPLGGPVGEAL